jgi:magnesium transporter
MLPAAPRLRRPVRVVLGATALLSFMSVWKASALAVAELGAGAFFVATVVGPGLGGWTPWVVLAACAVGVFVRSADIAAWALFVPGGLIGRARHAFGLRTARIAAGAVLAERVLLAALACVTVAHYGSGLAATAAASLGPARRLTAAELATVVAVALVGLIWIRTRLGQTLSATLIARGVWVAFGMVAVLAIAGLVTARRLGVPLLNLPPLDTTWRAAAIAAALSIVALGGGDALAREAHEFAPPRVRSLRRAGALVGVVGTVALAVPTLLYNRLVPQTGSPWTDAPLQAVARALPGTWFPGLLTVGVIVAAVLALLPAARGALSDVEQTLRRLSAERWLPEGLVVARTGAGSITRALDVTVVITVAIIVATTGQVAWLGRAYAFSIAATVLLKMAVLIRLRRPQAATAAVTTPLNVVVSGKTLPAGLWLCAALALLAGVTLLVLGDLASIITAAGIAALAVTLEATGRQVTTPEAEGADAFELLAASDVSLGQVEARPGNVLVSVRSPYSLAHVATALQGPADRDVVVMTVRLLGARDDDPAAAAAATPAERQLFSEIAALAERHGRPVRLLIVPAHNVFDGVVSTIIRLRSSEVYVGESASLTADDQSRLLGEAWERVDKPEGLKVRLVILHHSGRADAYHLGAHPPTLTPGDVDLIHRLWLDATKTLGPHVHHHDVVRAALTHMEQQLKGPQRDDALGLIRQTARPADELAAAVHQRDFSRLRDMTRNRPASDLAEALTQLSEEDQVIAFRVLPRKDAAAVFEYLSHEAQESLLKGMAQEDVASILNNMAPDDRTMFLEELPATATRQLLSLLTPAERTVAVTLLGYPETSVGRLMTPHYVAVREQWSIKEVLDYIRAHGRDSETLNHIYVIDDHGVLIDDIRIRELLITSLDALVSDVMDRRFVALKATDDHQTALTAFKQNDRTALPVTDTGGQLIGIITIDDMLDVAEAAATDDIQRIGGVEALDEPYMEIGFWPMIRKRVGWLTVLFLSEMLTSTAMTNYGDYIAKYVALAYFVPLIMSSGGNSGSQASTLVIRALALGEVRIRDWWRVSRREIAAGLTLGATLGCIGIFRITVWSLYDAKPYGEHWPWLALTIGVALVGVVGWGTLMGSMLPFVLKRLGFDPATSSSPFVATLVDVTGIVIYFNVARLIYFNMVGTQV